MKTIFKYVLIMVLPTAIFECSCAGDRLVPVKSKEKASMNVSELRVQAKRGDSFERNKAINMLGVMDDCESLKALEDLREYYWGDYFAVTRELARRGDEEANDYLVHLVHNKRISDKQRVEVAAVLIVISTSERKYQEIQKVLEKNIDNEYVRKNIRDILFRPLRDDAQVAKLMIQYSMSQEELDDLDSFFAWREGVKYSPDERDMIKDMIAERRLELKEMRANSLSNQVPLKASETEN
jgi:hypothetical protein